MKFDMDIPLFTLLKVKRLMLKLKPILSLSAQKFLSLSIRTLFAYSIIPLCPSIIKFLLVHPQMSKILSKSNLMLFEQLSCKCVQDFSE